MADELQLPYLETFSQAAELASFTAAAKALRLTQAAVSQRIQALERALGKSLFQRRGGRVLLTEAGQVLFDYTRRILALHREARDKISGQATPVTGEFTVGASSIPGEYILPSRLSEFRQAFPMIQIRAAISDSLTVVQQVERGQVSFGLVGHKTDNSHLVFRLLAKDRLVVVVRPDHELSKRKRIGLKEFCRHPMIVREAGSGLRHAFERALKEAGKSPGDLTIAMELGSNEAIKRAVIRGAGIAVLSTYAVRDELESGQLKTITVPDICRERELFIVLDKRRVLSLPATQFLRFLESQPIRASTP